MIAKELISDEIPVLHETDSGNYALHKMETLKISNLPLVKGCDFLGLLSDEMIYTQNFLNEKIGSLRKNLLQFYVFKNQHIYDVIGMMSDLKLTTIPVLDDKKKYMGSITIYDLMPHVGQVFSAFELGGVVVLEINPLDYQLSEIAQIVESNDAKILNLHVKSSADSKKIEVSLKINRNDLDSIIQDFLRYNYLIKNTFVQKNNIKKEMFEDRYHSLMRILNT